MKPNFLRILKVFLFILGVVLLCLVLTHWIFALAGVCTIITGILLKAK